MQYQRTLYPSALTIPKKHLAKLLYIRKALKSNNSLHFAVLTGCLRVSKESIFTGLNNLKTLSITDVRYDEFFVFTEKDVHDLLHYYGISDKFELIKEWFQEITTQDMSKINAFCTAFKKNRY